MRKKILILMLIPFLIGCGSGSSSEARKVSFSYDMRDYLPLENSVKEYLVTTNTPDGATKDIEKEEISFRDNRLIYRNAQTDEIIKNITINENTVVEEQQIFNFEANRMERFFREGERVIDFEIITPLEDIEREGVLLGTISKKIQKRCNFDSLIDELNVDSVTFVGDILKFRCVEITLEKTTVEEAFKDVVNFGNGEVETGYDIYYFYMQKKSGVVAIVNDNCLVKTVDGIHIEDDIRDSRDCTDESRYRKLFI